ncbi:FAD-dependent oxidoreductase [Streptomyces sp. NBC_00249]|uniref:NAD(P)/FAD-dependent oxidoreductase n=1 Tax=Streptomyces sp. NBC_00249 TaxID=2975690 RepID=UPI00224FBC6E|nr:FAD-dependent oxidoreductase [Streptomyces sp. NBC_00249]MCX5197273.1 FAD-dependent oxidoreductase [Streptomyces sp. NBC_00249]
MPDILVIGGGFAGVWAAAAAVRGLQEAGASRSVALVSPGDDLVLRPRLYEADPHTMRVPLSRVLDPVGVHRTAATVTAIDTAARRVTATDGAGRPLTLRYDRLVLASGSRLVRPALPGAGLMFDVDDMDAATALDTHLHGLPRRAPGPGRYTAVVVGSGFTGLETATELVGRLRALAAPHGAAAEVRVVLLERADALGPGLGPGPRPVIAGALTALGVETRLATSLERVEPEAAHLSDGTLLPARTVVWTGGVRASALTTLLPAARDPLGRLEVDEFLQVTGVPGVYAAGDTAAARADATHLVLPSCQYAIPLGKHAGHNAAASLTGGAPLPFRPAPYVTTLDLGDAGAVSTTGWERTVRLTGAEAKTLKRTLTGQWIRPPLDDAAELLRQADPAFRTRRTPAP